MNLAKVGPIDVPLFIEPTSTQAGGRSNSKGGLPIKCSFVLGSRTDAECLEELINNRAREQSIGGDRGVLEWVETNYALSRWRGWWLFTGCEISYARGQVRSSSPDGAYIPVAVSAVYFGAGMRPVVIATHRELVDDYGVVGQALTCALGHHFLVDPYTFGRANAAGAAVYAYKGVSKRIAVRQDPVNANPANVAALRPRLRDAAGIVHWGPRQTREADGIRLESGHLRVTIGQTAANHWLVEGWIAGAWYVLGALRVRTTAAAAGGAAWSIGDVAIADDRVAVRLLNLTDDADCSVRVEIRACELGMRVINGSQPTDLQWLTAADGAAGVAVKPANYLEDNVALGNGAKRYIALVKNTVADDLANWKTRIGAGHLAMVGFTPPAPQNDDRTADQAKQFLFDRTEVLTLE